MKENIQTISITYKAYILTLLLSAMLMLHYKKNPKQSNKKAKHNNYIATIVQEEMQNKI